MPVPVLLPLAAIEGHRDVPALGPHDSVASWGPASAMEPMDRSRSDGHLIPEGAHRRDWLQFFVSGQTFESTYTVGHKIGEGGFGKVFQVTHKVLGTSRAVKRLGKSAQRETLRKNELAALLELDHPHIVRLVEYFDEEDYFYLVFELCDGPDLYDRIRNEPNGRMSEYEASLALRHMLKALQCCHSQFMGHYDIKPENFMYASKDLNNLQMVDLGMSSGFGRRNRVKGTAMYMAPEFWDGIYGPEGDVWSCGVVLFVMLTGQPFLEDVPPSIFKREIKVKTILRNRLRYAFEAFNLSAHAQDLLTMMLTHDRHGRPSVKEALRHPFNSSSYEKEKTTDPQRLMEAGHGDAKFLAETLAEVLRNASKEPMMKRVARLAMAHICSGGETQRLAFRMLDHYGYGELSISVLEKDMEERGIQVPEDLDDIFEAVDLNRDGYLGYLGFVAVTLPLEQRRDEKLLRVAFDILDQGKDGFIGAADLAAVFGRTTESETCKVIVADISPDGRVSWERFRQMMGED